MVITKKKKKKTTKTIYHWLDKTYQNLTTNPSWAPIKTYFLKYLKSEYKKFLDSLDLSDAITVECKLGNALFAIQNNYKDGWWSFVVVDDPTHQVELEQTKAQYTAPIVPTRPNIDDTTLTTQQLKAKQSEHHDYRVCTV